MAFDQTTRNRLNTFVGKARTLLTDEFTRQLQSDYGIDPGTGRVDDVAGIIHLDDRQRETARILRDTLHHYSAGKGDSGSRDEKTRIAAIDRIVREQAFTVLNRLAALRMMEARGLLITSIAEGARSDGFQLYQQLAGVALGETDEAYIAYIFSLFDEFAVDLPVLFDRFSPQGRLFPSVRVLRQLLGLINDAEIAPLWAEDETIGWIYQYFNSKEERQQMRKESSAPRNSRELAVLNQFFTPRYVVEFLTDNSLGRIWYEMTTGQTRLVDECRYLVRRPVEVFLRDPDKPLADALRHPWVQAVARGDFSQLPDDPSLDELNKLSLVIDGYDLAEKYGYGDCITWADRQCERYLAEAVWPDSSLELWLILFRLQRYHGRATIIESNMTGLWRRAYLAFKRSFEQEDLSQEELLRQPVYIPHRPLKDPREIKMLDPACGSMHFGLYAFDLFETIYDEAWEMGVLGEWAAEYRDKAAFMRDVPRLIIEHNIHGIDIDARAVQIAGLSLWLRAQRSWQAQRVKARNRPTIARSNVVVAEPMPGDEAELEAFLAAQFDETAQDQIVAGLVRRVFEAMKLAGEAGSLLKIEEEIASDIAAAKEKWTTQPKVRQSSLFEQPHQVSLPVAMASISEAQFWERLEERIYTALERFAEQAAGEDSYRRRLFADDAARGFAFVDICRKRYEVTLMNPPFGEYPRAFKVIAAKTYESGGHDLITAFVERCLGLLSDSSMLGAITSRTVFFASTTSPWREHVLLNHQCHCWFELGGTVLDDAMVETCMFVYNKREIREPTIFHNCIDFTETEIRKAVVLDSAANLGKRLFLLNLNRLRVLPSVPFSYWIPDELLRAFVKYEALEDLGIRVRVGLQTGDDFRFIRCCWETPVNITVWYPHAKGGENLPYATNIHLSVNWENGGREIESHPSGVLRMYKTAKPENGLSEGLTFPYRTHRFSPAILPANVITGVAGMGIYSSTIGLFELCSVLNSAAVNEFIDLRLGLREINALYQAGTITPLPFPNIDNATAKLLSLLGESSWRLSIYRFQGDFENAYVGIQSMRAFEAIEQLQVHERSTWENAVRDVMRNQDKIDNLVGNAYELSAELISRISESQKVRFEQSYFKAYFNNPAEQASIVVELTTGALFGRWDIRYATGEIEPPPLPDPFAPLPICPPGLFQNADGLPVAREDVPTTYPLRISWPGILVDDDGHPEDIVSRVREVLHLIWDDNADSIEAEACTLLGVNSLRDYFGNPNKFFDDHFSRYSKSRRTAPIYWPLTTTGGSYSLWLYYHRLDAGTLYQCVNDFVDPKLGAVQRQLNGLRNRSRDREDERELEGLTDLAVELETFRRDLLDLARFWRPNLNDGVEITAAPLCTLFGHRQWRSRLEGTWGKLQEGEYDWAHLAMSIWPSRVVPKCTEDRSLAIAHDIEKLFWVEEGETWRPTRPPDQEAAHQVDIRQSAERDHLRDLFAELAPAEGRYLPAMQVWQWLADGEWDHRPLGLHLYPERAAVAAFDDATRVYPHLDQPDQKLLQKATLKNKQLLTKRLVERGMPELVSAVEATLADEPAAFAELWRALESGKRDDLPLALELWPERVVGKALRDSDLAAQHGLFDFFWYDEPGAGIRRRQPIDREIAHEVERRGGDRL